MSKKVLMLSGSPRRGGNSDLLCVEFARGAAESGHEVKKTRGGKEDRALLRLLFLPGASRPVRLSGRHGGGAAEDDRRGCAGVGESRVLYYIVTMADENAASAVTTLACLRGYADCVEGAVEKGVIIGGGVYEPGRVNDTPAMQKAYAMGKNV